MKPLRAASRYVFAPSEPSTLRVVDRAVASDHDSKLLFPVRRVFCVGRNYYNHAVEMEARHKALGISDGADAREPPFFFQKAGHGAVVDTSTTTLVRYPPSTQNLEFECELVVGLASGCRLEDPLDSVAFYGVGCDLTRRDLQNDAKAKRRPWDMAKSFDDSAPCGPLVYAPDVVRGTGCHLPDEAIMTLSKNGSVAQQTTLGSMIFSVAEAIMHLDRQIKLQAGDLLFTGTPAGVGALQPGDEVECAICDANGLHLVPPCAFRIVSSCD